MTQKNHPDHGASMLMMCVTMICSSQPASWVPPAGGCVRACAAVPIVTSSCPTAQLHWRKQPVLLHAGHMWTQPRHNRKVRTRPTALVSTLRVNNMSIIGCCCAIFRSSSDPTHSQTNSPVNSTSKCIITVYFCPRCHRYWRVFFFFFVFCILIFCVSVSISVCLCVCDTSCLLLPQHPFNLFQSSKVIYNVLESITPPDPMI